MQQDQLHNEEFVQNAKGVYSHRQIRALILWFLWNVITFCIAGFSLAYGLQGALRVILLIITSLFLLTNLFTYGTDLIQHGPMSTSGQVAKQIRKFKGPAHYDVTIRESDLRVRAPNQREWVAIEDGMRYEIYFTPRTKWLLSYRQLNEPTV